MKIEVSGLMKTVVRAALAETEPFRSRDLRVANADAVRRTLIALGWPRRKTGKLWEFAPLVVTFGTAAWRVVERGSWVVRQDGPLVVKLRGIDHITHCGPNWPSWDMEEVYKITDIDRVIRVLRADDAPSVGQRPALPHWCEVAHG